MHKYTLLREIEYRYHVRHVPYIAYSMKQIQSLASREEVIANVGSRQARWRVLRKIYALRVEFEQAGSLGMLQMESVISLILVPREASA